MSRSAAIPSQALCLYCNYRLRDLPECRCPECGQHFDPARPETMNLGRPLSSAARAILRPVFWPFCLPLALLMGWVLLESVRPRFYYMGGFGLIVLLWLAACILFVAHGAIVWFTQRIHRQPFRSDSDRRFARRWRLLWAVVTVLTLAAPLQLPLRLGFCFARPELDRIVSSIGGNPAPSLVTRRRVGPYMLSPTVHRRGSALIFTLDDDGEEHFIYCPDGSIPSMNLGSYGHLSGPWYWLAED